MDSTPTNQNSAASATSDTKEAKSSKTFTQDEVNEIVSKRLAEANAKADERSKQAVNDAIADYERKAKMSEEERLKETYQQKDNEIAEKERNITLRENRANAIEALADKGIDTKLVELVVDISPEQTINNVKALEKAFNEAVQRGIEQKLAGKTPPDFGDGTDTKSKQNSNTYTKGSVTAF